MEESGGLRKTLLMLVVLGALGAIFMLPRDPGALVQTQPGVSTAAISSEADAEPVLADASDSPETPKVAAIPADDDVRVTTARALNMRAAPSTNGAVVASLPLGTRVSVQDTEGRWLFVSTESGATGWISSRFAAAQPAQ